MLPFMLLLLIGALLIGLPVAFSLSLSSVVVLLGQGLSLQAFTQNLSIGMNSFPLLAIPMFILAGQLMNSGGITSRVFTFADHLVGRIRGGLGQVNIFASLIFAGMSGAAIADASGLGIVELKAMRDAGYDDDFSVAITAASSTVGPIIPPSIAMVVFGMTAEVSIGRLFIGGIIPGLLMTLALMALTYGIAVKRNYPIRAKITWSRFIKDFFAALPALLTPVIIVGGILSGVFTPTEAGAVAVLYSILIGLFVYRELKFSDLFRIFADTMITTSKIMIIVGAAKVFGWILAYYNIPVIVAQGITSITNSPLLISFLLVGLYIFLGCFMEAAAIIVMTVPVFLPLAVGVGIDPIFLGVVLTMCLSIGTLTPPIGTVMYVMCDIGNISVERFTRVIMPYLGVLLLVIILVVFFPSLITFLPKVMMP